MFRKLSYIFKQLSISEGNFNQQALRGGIPNVALSNWNINPAQSIDGLIFTSRRLCTKNFLSTIETLSKNERYEKILKYSFFENSTIILRRGEGS